MKEFQNEKFSIYSRSNGYVIVSYSYIYNEDEIVKFYLVREVNNKKDEYYFKAAKELVEKDKENNILEKFSKKYQYDIHSTNSHKGLFTTIKVATLALFVGGGIFTGIALYNLSKVNLILNAGFNGNFNNEQIVKLKVKKGTHFKDLTLQTPTTDGDYVFDKYIHNGSSEDFVINQDEVVFATYNENISNPKSFSNDSWLTFINVADKGLDELKNTYSKMSPFSDEVSNGKSKWEEWGSTFVIQDLNNEEEVKAKTRNITLDILNTNTLTYDFPVRVIGENHDEIDDKTRAALTFQFNDAVDLMYYNEEKMNAWLEEDETTHEITESKVRVYLRKYFITYMPDSIQKSIKTVKKVQKYSGKSATEEHPEHLYTTEERVFIVSSGEAGLELEGYLPEGKRYAFFDKHKEEDEAYRRYYSSQNLNYWLRSPSSGRRNSVAICDSAKWTKDGFTEFEFGVVPAFSIGQSTITGE